FHIGAEWTSARDRAFVGRILLAVLAMSLAGAGQGIPPLSFVTVLAVAVVAQLMLEALASREGAATIIEPSRQNGPPKHRNTTEAVSLPSPGDEAVEAMR